MSDASIGVGPFRRFVDERLIGENSDELVVEYGEFTWTSAADVDELPLSYIDQFVMAKFTKKSATGVTQADGETVTDGVITSGKLTIARTAHADTTQTVFYEITGYPRKS